MASRTSYWLVGNPNGSAKVVQNTTAPRGFQYTFNLGPTTEDRSVLQKNFATAQSKFPSSVDISSAASGAGFNSLPTAGQSALDTATGAINPALTASGDLFGSIAGSINSVTDFLKLIAWLFHPRNILRAVEFFVGIVLMIFGLHAAWQARGERAEGFTTSESALTRSELGRVATELGRSARGGSRPRRPASAPHVTRRRALAQRYTREERVRERERKGEKPAGHAKRTKGSGAGTKKTR